jgi:integrator complex subunit 3
MANQVRLGILTSLRQILEKRVLPSLSPLMNNPKLDKELQLLIQESFPEFCRATQNSSPPTADGVKTEDFKELDGDSMIVSSSSESVLAPPSLIPASDTHLSDEPVFSEEEDQDDIPIGKCHVFTMATYFFSPSYYCSNGFFAYLFSHQDKDERQDDHEFCANNSSSIT